jgi:hypothetical protein
MKMKPLLLLLAATLTSCVTHYNVVMTSVEAPENHKTQFGETKILSLSEKEITKYTYEDDLVSFT